MKDLGCANSWDAIRWYDNKGRIVRVEKEDTTPDEFKKCAKLGHKIGERKIGHCLHRCSCGICDITYTVDSSD